MSNVIKFPTQEEQDAKKEEEHFEFACARCRRQSMLLLHELDQDDDALGWHRANIVETLIMELIVDLCAGASVETRARSRHQVAL